MFDSKHEKLFADRLKDLNIDYGLHSDDNKFVLLDAFTSHYQNHRQATYKPDFLFNYKDRKIIVEIKGFMYGGSDALFRYKFFDLLCQNKNIEFYIVAYIPKRKEFYFYRDKGRAKLGNNVKTFWEKANID